MSNAYEQFRNQRALARMQRARHGADTTLDDAEERHERIWRFVFEFRRLVPFPLILIVPWIGVMNIYLVGITVLVAFATYVVGLFAGAIVAALYSPDRKGRRDTVREWFYRLGAVPMFLIGLKTISIGAIVAGLSLMLFPSWWQRWAQRVMNRTDYSRLRAAAYAEPAAPRIIE